MQSKIKLTVVSVALLLAHHSLLHAICYSPTMDSDAGRSKAARGLGFQLFLQPTPSVKTRPSDIRIFMHAQSSSVLTFNFAVGGRSPWTENLGDKYGTSRCFNCGNGIIDPAETCDDSNTVDGDGSLAALGQEMLAAGVKSSGEPLW